MSITNESKPTTSVSNSSKVESEVTWDTNTTTWNTEVRNWNDMGSTIINISTVLTGSLWSSYRFPWTEATPWTTDAGITNISKPI